MAALVEVVSSSVILSTLSRKFKFVIPSVAAYARKSHSDAAQNSENYDIIIAGGGMIGTTLACAIANNERLKEKRVLLLEGGKSHKYEQSQNYSNRVVALNQLTRTLLSSIGAWQHIEAARFGKINMMQVWDAYSDAVITFNEAHLERELAYVVEIDLLLHAVYKQLSEKKNVEVVYGARVENVGLPKTDTENATVELENGKRFMGKLLIGADGVNSRVREAMNVKYLNWSYDQYAIVATLELSEPTENCVAWQRFLPTGPIALLPLSNELSSLVWSLTTEEAKRLMKVDEEDFVDHINDALWRVYPKEQIVETGMKLLQQMLRNFSFQDGVSRQLQPSVSKIVDGSRAMFPLGFGHSVYYVKQGTVLVGDAAHRVHPLAGQGVNLGFGDVVTLIETLSAAVWNGALINDMSYLTSYESKRQCQVVPTMLTIDGLHRLYKKTATPIVLARSLGLQAVNAFPILKEFMIRHASERKTEHA